MKKFMETWLAERPLSYVVAFGLMGGIIGGLLAKALT